MDASAIVMFAIGAVFLWGGVLAAIINYIRASRRQTD